MSKPILAFGPVLRDFWDNLLHLRLFLSTLIAVVTLSGIVMYWAEHQHLAIANPELDSAVSEIVFLTAGSLLPVNVTGYAPRTMTGKFALIVQGVAGLFLLGIAVWLVQESLKGHQLVIARYFLFPTRDSLRE